jgi:methylmalonyl-CoA/ethylmalonyl-CoA epimerase
MSRLLHRLLSALTLTLAVASSAQSAQPSQSGALDIEPYAITLSVPSVEAAAAWYERVLEFKIEKTKSYPEFGTKLAFLKRGDFRVELIEDAKAKPGLARADAPAHTAWHGYSQFMFQTKNLAAIKQRMQAQKVPIHFEFENAELGVRFFFIRDLNQNLITFVQRL